MPTPQSAILPEPRPNALFLVLRVNDPAADASAIGKIFSGLEKTIVAVRKLDKGKSKLVASVAFGSEFWDRLTLGKRPKFLKPFSPVKGPSLEAPTTGGDVLLHILSDRHDLNFELAMRLRAELGERVSVMEEVHGFRYLDSRDLTGFIDGTENPKGKGRGPAAIIGKEDPDFAGGSYVFTQRYVHNFQKWRGLSLQDQERAVGRTKKNSREIPDKKRDAQAHISRVVIEENGKELEIVRHSFPYGTTSEAGLFFIAYTRDLRIPFKMLERMMGASGDGRHDLLMENTKPVSGATFFAPSVQMLKKLG
ncbi:MAG: Dyp-type peroxidase [Bdellovibrionota bacterium]